MVILSVFGIVTSSYAQATAAKQEQVVISGTKKKELNLVKEKVAAAEKQAKKEKKEAKAKAAEEKLNKKIDALSKSIAKDKKQITKLASKIEKGKAKGKLAPLTIDKMNGKIS